MRAELGLRGLKLLKENLVVRRGLYQKEVRPIEIWLRLWGLCFERKQKEEMFNRN